MASRTVETKYFHFRQNNSGGSFDIEDADGIGVEVWIEALNADDACRRAESIGIYFDGCEYGRDCDCCGDRWHRPWGDGYDASEIDQKFSFSWHGTVYVHHMDGSIERINAPLEAA